MNQFKFSLADVLTLIAAILFGFICFLGMNFSTLGDDNSFIIPVIITVLLWGTAFDAKLLKCTRRKFKFCFIMEMALLLLFTVFTAYFAYSSFPHYFVVSGKKTEIQSKLTEGITQAENMFAEYEDYAKNRESLYRSQLQSVCAAKNINPTRYAKYGFDNSISDVKQIDNMMFIVHADLFPTNYEEMKRTCSIWLTKARHSLNNGWAWNFGVVNVVNSVESNSKEWLNNLVKLSTVREEGEQAEDFDYNLSFNDVKEYFTTQGKPTLFSIVLALAAYLIMLLSWFITDRHPRSNVKNLCDVIKDLFGEKGSFDDDENIL